MKMKIRIKKKRKAEKGEGFRCLVLRDGGNIEVLEPDKTSLLGMCFCRLLKHSKHLEHLSEQ